jgi:hypothetical protein
MFEQEFKIEPYGVRMVCGSPILPGAISCDGELQAVNGGIRFNTDITEFRHVCSACGTETWLTEKYPTVRWRAK